MHEIVVNLHMHTTYSDGHGSHADIARAAMKTGLDAIIVTDHNVWVNGPEGYYQEGGKRVLMLVGEEIHDQARDPQKNHLLVFGADAELSPYAPDPQRLLDQVRLKNALAFIAHPFDVALPAFGEADISWVNWEVRGFNGIELWNGFSELKTVIKSLPEAIFYAFNPQYIAHAPLPETLQKWDELTQDSKRWVAIGGSDAHALPKHLGPLRRTLFPYRFHFSAINTHVYLPGPLTGNLESDRRAIYQALRDGHAFVGYDLPASTRGFRFTAVGRDRQAWMGDEMPAKGGVTIQIHLPRPTELVLVKNGRVLKTWLNRENITHITSEPGVYRVEAYLQAFGQRRGWIFSNPIYLRA
ncbi:MAG: CehA/McbA family metallohydrolase [Anaerolineaceae bacterium]|nr:CehA/McbA family metallohydrolase [Anaerolineaceae bacterium]